MLQRTYPSHKGDFSLAHSNQSLDFQILIEYKADIEATSVEDYTPLHLAAFGGHVRIVEVKEIS